MSSANQASVSWTPFPGATSYAVYQGVNGGPLSMWTTTPATTVTVPISGANPAFQVHAVGPNGFDLSVSSIATVSGGYNPYGPYPPPYPPGGVGLCNPARSTVIPAAPFAPASIGTQVTVSCLDVNGNPIPNQQISMTPGRQGDSATPVYVNPMTGPNGQVVFQVRGFAPGLATFNTTAGGQNLPAVSITFQ